MFVHLKAKSCSLEFYFPFFPYFRTVPEMSLAWPLDGDVILLYTVINDNERKTFI